MWWWLLGVLFLIIPILEVVVIGQVQDHLGWGWTILLLVTDSVVGAWLVRSQGLATWRRLTAAGESLRMPSVELSEGALILFGGALLLTPGFFTDAVGFISVIPITRKPLAALIRSALSRSGGIFTVMTGPEPDFGPDPFLSDPFGSDSFGSGDVIDVDPVEQDVDEH